MWTRVGKNDATVYFTVSCTVLRLLHVPLPYCGRHAIVNVEDYLMYFFIQINPTNGPIVYRPGHLNALTNRASSWLYFTTSSLPLCSHRWGKHSILQCSRRSWAGKTPHTHSNPNLSFQILCAWDPNICLGLLSTCYDVSKRWLFPCRPVSAANPALY